MAGLVSFSLCVFCSFFWNSLYVFREWLENGKWFIALMKMYPAYPVSWILLNDELLYFCITILGISGCIAPVLSLVVCVLVSFIMNRYCVFR